MKDQNLTYEEKRKLIEKYSSLKEFSFFYGIIFLIILVVFISEKDQELLFSKEILFISLALFLIFLGAFFFSFHKLKKSNNNKPQA